MPKIVADTHIHVDVGRPIGRIKHHHIAALGIFGGDMRGSSCSSDTMRHSRPVWSQSFRMIRGQNYIQFLLRFSLHVRRAGSAKMSTNPARIVFEGNDFCRKRDIVKEDELTRRWHTPVGGSKDKALNGRHCRHGPRSFRRISGSMG